MLLDYGALKKDLAKLNDGQPGLVACRLWQLHRILRSHGLAQRRNLPHL